MKRLVLILALALTALSALAQNAPSDKGSAIQTVSVSSKGQDVRSVLSDMFNQEKKSFVIEPNIHFALYLSLNDVEFEEALDLVLKTASLKYELQNGIYFISKDKSGISKLANASAKPTGKLSPMVLRKKLTISFHKEDIRALFADLTNQTGVMIEIDPSVPNYKVDVLMKGVSLKYALQNICRPAGLTYRFTDNLSLMVVKTPLKEEVRIEPAH